MQDFVPLGTGNSRYLKSVENFKSLYPTYDAFVAALVAGTLPIDLNGVNDAGIAQKGTALNKHSLLQDTTAFMFGMGANAVPDDVFKDVIGRFNEFKLRPVNLVELGPYDVDESAFVCDGNEEAYAIYARLMAATIPWVTNGRYSYAYENKKAYRLDHVTKQAALLCDLASYAGTAKPEYDRILAIDDQYIYMGRNDRWDTSDDEFDITLLKFDHSGALISSKSHPYDGTSTNMYDYNNGFSGSGTYYSILYPGAEQNIYQTKNYIVIQNEGAQSTNGWRYQHTRVINKSTLGIATCGYFYNYGTRLAVYEKDLFYCVRYDGSSSESRCTKCSVFNLASQTAQTPPVCNKIVDYDNITISFGGTTYYLTKIVGVLYTVDGGSYYALQFSTDEYGEEGVCYTVIKADEFNTTTGAPSISYLATDAAFAFGDAYYDPVEDKFHCYGVDYEVYPGYVAPCDPGTVNERFTATPFFRTDGHYYFLRNRDGMVYKLKDKPWYVIDRVEVRG